MNTLQKEQLAQNIKNCWSCNEEINKILPYFIEDFFNSKINKMDVRIQCFYCRFHPTDKRRIN